MTVWKILFYPGEDERNSPFSYILNLTNPKEKAAIKHRFDVMASRPLQDWPSSWQHQISGKIFQLTVKRHRFLYCLDGEKIVILHAFFKRSQRTPKKEIRRAETHYHRYSDSK